MDIQLGLDAENKKKSAAKRMEEAYMEHSPAVSDLSWFFYNVFLENEGNAKYAPLIGEKENAICAFIGFVMGDTPVMIRSWAGTGKTVIANTVWSLIPESLKYEVEMSSQLGIWYQAAEINDHRFIFFNEFQNSADNKEVEKVLKLWGEGRSASRTRADMTRSNADEDANIQRVLEYKPFFTTLAVENKGGAGIWNDEFGRRMVDLYTDVSETQTQYVIEYMLKVYEEGIGTLATMEQSDKDMLHYHIQKCLDVRDSLIKEYRFPAASIMRKQIPSKFVQARSALPLLIKMINAFSVYNYRNRIITKEGVMLITPEDLFLTWACYGKRFAQKCFNMDILADELLQVLPRVKNPDMPSRVEMLNEREIKRKMKEMKLTMPTKKLKMLLESFTDSGIIDFQQDSELEGELCYFKTGVDSFEENFDYREIIDHCKLMVKQNYPEYAAEYIRKFCTEPIVEHPYKPFKVNLLTGDRYTIERPWPEMETEVVS